MPTLAMESSNVNTSCTALALVGDLAKDAFLSKTAFSILSVEVSEKRKSGI